MNMTQALCIAIDIELKLTEAISPLYLATRGSMVYIISQLTHKFNIICGFTAIPCTVATLNTIIQYNKTFFAIKILAIKLKISLELSPETSNGPTQQ